jgi:hypothetical protein
LGIADGGAVCFSKQANVGSLATPSLASQSNERIFETAMTTIWELDFYSRPVLDENQKKLWEVLICQSSLDIKTQPDDLFRYAELCPNSEVNSIWLKGAIERAIAASQQNPDRIRFFRRQMNNMISRACEEAGVKSALSRRTLMLNQWLDERMRDVYPKMDNYQEGSNPSVAMPSSPAQVLPDALMGDRWAFVTLPAGDFADMSDWAIDFGEAFSLDLFGLAPDTPIPGLIIYSARSLPLSAWMSGLELAYVEYREAAAQLVLETGGIDAWILANLTTAPLKTEAQNFEAAKAKANQIHFLAVQSNPESESFAGLWLMQQVNLG